MTVNLAKMADTCSKLATGYSVIALDGLNEVRLIPCHLAPICSSLDIEDD